MQVETVDVAKMKKAKKPFPRCADMVLAKGWKGLDKKCKREGYGILLLFLTTTIMFLCVCARILLMCQCGMGPARGVPNQRRHERGQISQYSFEDFEKQEGVQRDSDDEFSEHAKALDDAFLDHVYKTGDIEGARRLGSSQFPESPFDRPTYIAKPEDDDDY